MFLSPARRIAGESANSSSRVGFTQGGAGQTEAMPTKISAALASTLLVVVFSLTATSAGSSRLDTTTKTTVGNDLTRFNWDAQRSG